MNVKFIDRMGSDLSVVNAARVSFSKKSELIWEEDENAPTMFRQVLSDNDKKLIKYLAKHNHWSPFGHASVQVHVKAPIFVARQLVKHQVGLVWNEVSRRYVDEEPEFYIPNFWRLKPIGSIKQGSSDEKVEYDITSTIGWCKETYKNLLNEGVAPEMARMILPQNMYTEWYWSGTLYAFSRVCNLRCKDDSQKETRDLCWEIDKIIGDLFPVSWKELREN